MRLMKKKVLMICAVTALAVALAGCTQKNIVKGTAPAEPVFETQKGIVLDWRQIGDDLDDEFLNNEEYPMAVSVNYSVDLPNKAMELTLMVHAGTTKEEAVTFAKAAVRAVNDEAATQDFSIAKSSDTSYGGFFQENTLLLKVIPDGLMTDKGVWLVDMTIPAGSNKAIVPMEGAKIVEPTQAPAEDETPETTKD